MTGHNGRNPFVNQVFVVKMKQTRKVLVDDLGRSQSLRKSGLCRLYGAVRLWERFAWYGRNPFVNQVFVVLSDFPKPLLKTARKWLSQSLRKSGLCRLSSVSGLDNGLASKSQSLRKSGLCRRKNMKTEKIIKVKKASQSLRKSGLCRQSRWVILR